MKQGLSLKNDEINYNLSLKILTQIYINSATLLSFLKATIDTLENFHLRKEKGFWGYIWRDIYFFYRVYHSEKLL